MVKKDSMKNIKNFDTFLNEDMKQEKLFDKLFKKLVPDEGKCKTLEGEILRAYAKLSYRYYNDGDLCTVGYGIETAGSAAIFLEKYTRNIPEISKLFRDLFMTKNERVYGQLLDKIGDLITVYIDEIVKTKKLTNNNTLDMLKFYDGRWDMYRYEDDYDYEDEDEDENEW